MSNVLNDVYFTYIRLYGSDMAYDIRRIIGEAETIAENTGDDVVAIAECMLSDLLD